MPLPWGTAWEHRPPNTSLTVRRTENYGLKHLRRGPPVLMHFPDREEREGCYVAFNEDSVWRKA